MAYKNVGALVQGLAPGTGKTFFLETFVELLKAKEEEYHIIAVTHVAAALASGGTVAHFRHACRYKKKVWIIADECSFMSAHRWG